MSSITRRQFAQSTAAGVATSGPILPIATAQSTLVPARGGTLRAAFVGAGASETLEPWNAGHAISSFQRSQALYEPLIRNTAGVPSPVLAESWEPNVDGSIWTIRVRPDVTFHDGQPLTAADVLGTFAYHLDPANQSIYGMAITLLDIANSRVIDNLTLELALLQPLGDLGDYIANAWVFIFPAEAGDLALAANGTGPFRLEQFTPGDRAVLTRNDAYWGDPTNGPFLDRLEILSIDSAEARVNALLAGQVDFADNVSHTQALTLQQNDRVSLLRFANPAGRAVMGFTMNVTVPPVR
ncbi:MAG: ABC transporter substrate-binding protein [Thermomicrobiales bacterium]